MSTPTRLPRLVAVATLAATALLSPAAPAVAAPERRISELPLLTPLEREQIVLAWNRTSVRLPRNATVHGLFEEQVDRAPDAVAIVSGGEELAYADLEARAHPHGSVRLSQGPSSLARGERAHGERDGSRPEPRLAPAHARRVGDSQGVITRRPRARRQDPSASPSSCCGHGAWAARWPAGASAAG